MGCGASARARIVAIDSNRTLLENPVDKPVLGVTTAAAVQGAPVHAADCIAAESQRKATIVQGLADAAIAIVGVNPVAAAGLAMAAADIAESMPAGSGPGAAPNQIASGFASTAFASAKGGSHTAAGLTEAAIAAAIAVAQARSKSSAEVFCCLNQVTEAIAPGDLLSPSSDETKPVIGKASPLASTDAIVQTTSQLYGYKRASYMEILSELFKG